MYDEKNMEAVRINDFIGIKTIYTISPVEIEIKHTTHKLCARYKEYHS